jgi:hypothetical protein
MFGAAVLCAVVLALAGCGSGAQHPATLPALMVRAAPFESLFNPGPIGADPAPLLKELRSLGVQRMRMFIWWNHVAPDPTAPVRPAGLDLSDPASYPAANWEHFDTIVRDAKALGLGLDVDVGPPPPRWASGAGAPHPSTQTWWKPNAAEFGQFVHAVGVRYSGSYTPPGSSTPLPRVNFWSIWNEPNLGFQLAPQAIDNSTVEVSSRYYRALLDSAWRALQETGHGHDQILIGELGPAGSTVGAGPGNFNSMAPLRFLRALYCVDSSYQPLQGAAATVRGCPPDAAGSAAFARDHPALFNAPGFAIHPYSQGLPPNQATPNEPDFAELASIKDLERALDRLQRTYGSNKRFPIWSTEFGYQTNPPETDRGVIPVDLAPQYLNWAEYLSWRDPRMRSYDQYQLTDDASGFFATALEYSNGTPKPTYDAYRMPIYLPATSTTSGHPLEVWGTARPARRLRNAAQRQVQIQFQDHQGSAWKTVKTVPLTDPSGYFDLLVTFDAAGNVRLAWSYPHGPEIFSRIVAVTVH